MCASVQWETMKRCLPLAELYIMCVCVCLCVCVCVCVCVCMRQGAMRDYGEMPISRRVIFVVSHIFLCARV